MPRTVTVFRLGLAASILLPLMVHAAGLGRLTVQSALGQPLQAEVAIVSVQPGETSGLNARIASPEAFRMAGIEFNAALLSVRVSLERRDGKPILRLSSTQPMNEPYVELLLELQWATGRLVREYTFLLDPVEYKPPQPVAAAPPPSAAVAKPAPAAAPAPVEAKPLVSEPRAAGTYQIKRGDTLSKVARENKPEGVSVNQMLVALYNANHDAFMRNNMFLMRSGNILKIPDRAAAAVITPAEATRMVRAQSVEFDEYKRGLGASVAAAPAKPTPAPERGAPGRIAPMPAEPARRDTKDQIKLSKADAAKPSAPAARAAAEDDRASMSRALKESQSRVTDLEKQVKDLQKLVEMKNQQLALLEQKAAPKPAPEPPKPVPAAPKPAAEPAKAAPEAPKPAAPAPQAEAPKPAPPAAAKPVPEPAKAKPTPAAPPASPGLVDEFLGNPLALAGLGGVLVLLVGYSAWAWRRKKNAQAKVGGFGEIAAASAAGTAATLAEAAEPAAHAAAALGTGEEVDPIAEADVYLAYGRDAQAETILKDALASDPDRLVVHAKLLELYAQRKDKLAFEQTALKVKSLTGGSGTEWEKAMALGHAIDPDNGLYGKAAVASVKAPEPAQPAAAAPEVDFDIGASTSPGGSPAQFKAGDTVVLSAQEAAAAKMDFDIGATTQETVAGEAPKESAAAESPNTLDFDLEFDLGGAKPAAAPGMPSVSLDLGAPGQAAPGAAVDPKWQEVATKLDLAKAYEEMGDKSGARDLLNEALKDGDAAQQEEAKSRLAKLG